MDGSHFEWGNIIIFFKKPHKVTIYNFFKKFTNCVEEGNIAITFGSKYFLGGIIIELTILYLRVSEKCDLTLLVHVV